MKIKGIIMCEESQTITKAFRARGIECYSNDLKYCSGGRPEWHLMMSAFEAAKLHDFTFAICHPPCTHIAVSGGAHFKKKIADGRQQAGIDLFMEFTKLTIPHTAIENPVSIMSSVYRQPDQIIQPYFFGDKYQKTTCLWLKNFPPLYHSDTVDLFNPASTHVDRGKMITLGNGKKTPKWQSNIKADSNRGAVRSVTFPGIAQAMADQWGDYLLNKYQN